MTPSASVVATPVAAASSWRGTSARARVSEQIRRGRLSRKRLLLTPELPQQPNDRIEAVRHALLERDDRVVGDVDPLGAHLGAALGDVAEPDPGGGPAERGAIARVERVHFERRELDEKPGPRESRLVLLVVAHHVADVLAQEALDALVELLDAIDVLLHHPVRAVGLRGLEPERWDRLGLLEVEPDIRDEVADERERTDRRHGDRPTLGEEVHAGHAHEPRLAVDLGAARPALARLAVPPHGEVRRLRRLEAVDHVQDHHPLLGLHAIVLELAPRRVAPEDAQREGRHHFLSWKSALSSAGISGRGSRESWSAPSRSRNTTLTLPH